MNRYILLDKDNHYNASAIIETELTAKEVQNAIWEHENDPEFEGEYDSDTLEEALEGKGITISWISGDAEVIW